MPEVGELNQTVKRLGELLVESGFLTEIQLEKAMDISKKNFQSLGKVLVSTRTCSQNDVNNALEIQKYCKLEGLGGEIAIRALQLIRGHYLSPKEALERLGWLSADYNSYQEPEDILAARKALKDVNTQDGVAYGKAIEAIGDAFANNKLPARAEMKYLESFHVYQALLPDAAFEVSAILSKLSKLASSQNRAEDAKRLLTMAQDTLEEQGHKNSKEFAKLKHIAADYHITQRQFAQAEQHYLECFDMLEPVCGLTDPHVLETIRKYVEIVNKGKKDSTKVAAAARWREMSHESQPDKVTLGELLKGSRLVNEKDLTASWQYSKDMKVPLGRAFVDLKLISERQLQLTLKTQLLVRNNEVTAQLGIWLLLYAVQLNLELDEVLELFQCSPRTQSPLAEELRAASDKMQELEASLPPSHPDLAFAHAKQARFYYYRQQYTEADHHYKRALEILSANSEVAAESLIEMLDNHAQVKVAMEDLAEAVRISKTAVQLRSKYYGNESVPYAKGVEKLAQAFCAADDHFTAVSMLNRALAVKENLYGPDDKELLGTLEQKADCHVHSENLTSAEELYDRCLLLAECEYGKQNTNVDRIKKKLAAVCKDLGKADKAKNLMPTQLKKNTLQLRRDNII